MDDIVWALIGVIELSARLNTLVQVEIIHELKDEELTLLHKQLKERCKEIEVLYFPNIITIRVFANQK